METRAGHAALLFDKVLRRSENQGDRGYFWERNSALFLHGPSDDVQKHMRFRWETDTISSASGGGLSASSGGKRTVEGRWTIADGSGQMQLVLRHDDGEQTSFASRPAGQGSHDLNGEAWNRFSIA